MANQYDRLHKELKEHLNALEEKARTVGRLNPRGQMRLGTSVMWIRYIATEPSNTTILQQALKTDYEKERCLGVLGRILTVLTLMYLPNTTGDLRVEIVRAIDAIQQSLLSSAWL